MPHPGAVLAKQKRYDKKNPFAKQVTDAAVDLGRLGGEARARSLSNKRMHNIAVHAACARWGIPCHCADCK